MNRKAAIFSIAGIAVLVAAWAAFRPELLFVDSKVNEAIPDEMDASGEPGHVVLKGSFHAGAHETSGDAIIYDLGGGRRVLRLERFMTSNGPDVRVLLVAARDAADSDAVKSAGSVEVAKLKGNVGDQNYDLPRGVDLARHRAVTIWCNRFGVNFGTAPLSEVTATAQAR